MLMAKHPLDRILTVYDICRRNITGSGSLCHFGSKVNVWNMTLHEFIKAQGNSLFRKLLYYSKHCKLVGEDEICLSDSKTSFVLTSKERRTHLKNILENLEKWFSVIGLEEHLNESLRLYEDVSGLNFAGCGRPRKLVELMKLNHYLWPQAGNATPEELLRLGRVRKVFGRDFSAIRKMLIQDPIVQKFLSSDLAIYAKLEELFQKQLAISRDIRSVMHSAENSHSRLQQSGKPSSKAAKDNNVHSKRSLSNGTSPGRKQVHPAVSHIKTHSQTNVSAKHSEGKTRTSKSQGTENRKPAPAVRKWSHPDLNSQRNTSHAGVKNLNGQRYGIVKRKLHPKKTDEVKLKSDKETS